MFTVFNVATWLLFGKYSLRGEKNLSTTHNNQDIYIQMNTGTDSVGKLYKRKLSHIQICIISILSAS